MVELEEQLLQHVNNSNGMVNNHMQVLAISSYDSLSPSYALEDACDILAPCSAEPFS